MKHQVKLNLTKLITSGAFFTIMGAILLAAAFILGDTVPGIEIASQISGGSGG